MDKVRQLDKDELLRLDVVALTRKCDSLFFIALDAKSDYNLVSLAKCRMEDVYSFLRDERPLIEIYGGRNED